MANSSTTQSRSNVADLLKDVYVGELQDTIQNEVMFFKDASRKQMPLDGTDLVIDVHLGRNASVGNRDIDEVYPEAGKEVIKKGKIRAVRAFAGFQIDTELMKLSKRDEAAFARAVDVLMDSPKESLVKDLERQACGDGTGILATVTSESSGTITVDSTRFLEEGMKIEVWASATSTTIEHPASGSLYVCAIPSDTTFTVTTTLGGNASDPGSFTAGGVVRRAGNAEDQSGLVVKEMNGILKIADDDVDFMDIGYATYRRWRAAMVNASSAQLGPALISKLLLAMRQKSNAKPNRVWAHPNNAYAFIYGGNGTFPDVRFTTGNANAAGADKGNDGDDVTISLGGKRAVLRTSIDFSKTDVVAFNDADLLYGELNGVELEDGDGSHDGLYPVINSDGDQLPAVRGWFGWRGNMGCFRRNSFGRIYSLGTPDGL